MNMATNATWSPNMHQQRNAADKSCHGRAMERANVLPKSGLDRLLDAVVPRSPMRAFIDRLPTELENEAMDDIHGVGMSECDSNGGA